MGVPLIHSTWKSQNSMQPKGCFSVEIDTGINFKCLESVYAKSFDMNKEQIYKEVKVLCWMDERYTHMRHLSLSLSLSSSLSISWKTGWTGQPKISLGQPARVKNCTIKTSTPVLALITVPPMAEWMNREDQCLRDGSCSLIAVQREDARWSSPWELCRPHYSFY
jgi:hypothetical protein